jgi:Tfp pilus assembly protein PilX
MKPPIAQRGAAALAVSLVLLFGITLIAFFANRSLIFEQRTSANQYRSTRAFEMAEAGLEWAVARLNEDAYMSASTVCESEGAVKFADRYLPMTKDGFTALPSVPAAATHGFPGCSIDEDGDTSCGCPAVGHPPFGDAAEPRFRVEFSDVATDNWAVRITSYGCTNAGSPCDANGTPDATAVVSAVYKMKPTIGRAPAAALVTGAATNVTGNLNVINLDPLSNGITINSGTTVDLGSGTNVTTLPGSPPRTSVLDNDASLNALANADTNGDTFFKAFFGQTLSEYRNDSRTWLITSSGGCATNTRCSTCGSPAECGSAVSTAYDKGARQFWSDRDVGWSNSNLPSAGTLGTSGADGGVIFATSAGLEMRANLTAYGLFYAATATATDNWDFSGGGAAKVFGGFISRGNFEKGSGTLDLIYDANLFGEGGKRGTMVRVPGTWRDRATDYN